MGARVMHRFLSLVSRFGRDERGVFAVLFGLMAIVLIALGGAVVDYVSLEQARNRGQLALDAAALALQPEIFDDTLTTEDIRIRARDLVVNRIGDDRITITVGTPVINTDLGSLFFTADMTVPTIFVSLVGVQSLPARIQSEVRRGSLDVEVAVAVD
ncbi:MAG: TadE/TadG family type IV pilus assembly protein, partial [Devosia sp.]